MRKLIAAASALVALVIVPSALAAPVVTIDSVSKYGYSVSTTDGWQFISCTGKGYDSSWRQVATQGEFVTGDGYGGYTADGYGRWTPQTPALVHATVDCTLRHPTTRYEMRWRWFTKVRSGPNTSTRSRSSSCYIGGDGTGDLGLDCWGGRFASATWRFSLPTDARQISRAIIGYQGCCPNGTLTRRWSGNTAIVRLTNWRSYYVDRVRIRYQHRARTAVPVTETGTATATY